MNLNDIGLLPTDDLDVLTARMRIQRDLLLAGSDWAMTPDAPTDKSAWTTYRQQLRDFPSSWTPGAIANFPAAPDA